jgi:hypothetical protein
VRREVLYNILIVHWTSIELVMLINMFLNEIIMENVVKKHQLMVYADNVNLLGDNIDTIKRIYTPC